MKTIYSILKAALFLLPVWLFASCQDIVNYDELQKESGTSTGAPVIQKITLVDRVTEISDADLSQLILIQGSNLSGIKTVKFNDVEADLKEAYIKAKEVVIPVPRILPTEINNKITIMTELGETSANLKINIPSLIINGLFNEFTLPGDTTTITGDNFDLYKITKEDASIILGENKVNILEADQKTLTIEIPKNALQKEGIIQITSPEIKEAICIPYREEGTFINIQNKLWEGEQWLTDGSKLGDPKPINGQFSHITGVTVSQWDWYNQIHGCNFPTTDPDILHNLESYDLKFELNTDPDHPLSQMYLKFSMRFSIVYEWDLYKSGESLNTYGKWQTITLDAKTILGELYENSENFFSIAINPSVEMNLDFSIANVRLVKKQQFVK
ncbi:glycan-binding surface protein [Parabacteroides pacaensis]|uniref:glycan-binding surface protein n=1 Tax=Parabacteroides pacaensis TaxID=2086575 RepID=UPI000D10CACC|nr:glycan-binding surface protein [Parabacteroides pacaensis]